MKLQHILLSGATIIISFLTTFVVNIGMDWVKEVNGDRKEQAKLIVQLQERSKYLYGDVKAAPLATPSERLKATAAAAEADPSK
jgi:hypothetical protein